MCKRAEFVEGELHALEREGQEGKKKKGHFSKGAVEFHQNNTSKFVPASNKDPWEGQILLPQYALQLLQETRVHGQISFVDREAEAPENGLDGPAVIEGPANHAEAGEVDHDPLLPGRGSGGQARAGLERVEGADCGCGGPDPVKDRRRFLLSQCFILLC